MPNVSNGNRLVFELIAPQSNGTDFVGNVVIQVQGASPTVSGSTGSSGL